jgi:tetratricopeptide (TPR) repeat protein
MAKPILITLPFLMLVLDVWPLKRLAPGATANHSSRDRAPQTALPYTSGQSMWDRYRGPIWQCLREKLPLIGLGLGAVVFSLMRLGRIISADHVPLPLRISNAIVSYVKYLWHLLWPFDLAALYPFPSHVPAWQVMGSLVLLIGLTALFLYYLQRAPYLMVGWLWFLGSLVPKIGLVQAGLWPALADRWAYFPAIGLFVAIVWSAGEIWSRWSVLRRRMLAFSAAIYIGFLAMLCHAQVGYWANSTVLFERMIEKTEGNYVAHNNLGYVLIKEKRYDEARRHFERSIAINPKFEIPYVNIGTIYKDQGQSDEAIAWYRKALAINPQYARGHLNIGNIYFSRQEYVQAIHHFARGIEVDSDSALLFNSLGAALTKLGRLDEAARCFQTALRIDPGLKMASRNLEAIVKARSERNSG